MARSTYVYVPFVQDISNSRPIGAFTVKHEMIDAVATAIQLGTARKELIHVTRYRDGQRDSGVDISDQFDWRYC